MFTARSRKASASGCSTCSGKPNFFIQVIPSQARVFQGGGFQVLSFNEGSDVVYVDGAGGNGQMITHHAGVRRLTVLFNKIRAAALSAEESEGLVRTIMEST
ncbi:Scr1 family TA system antitoxin-like transcriptional regulator [Spirillospora sp. NPDC048819]|uniref:Scr1 family TA system antitoxin-like transcriptional regulator n=1 Tax=Spirillospora sp. NPDC048819 TaxID=3155268 RepID=UPI0033D3020A